MLLKQSLEGYLWPYMLTSKKKRSKINDLSFHLKKLVKEEKIKLQESKRKKVMKYHRKILAKYISCKTLVSRIYKQYLNNKKINRPLKKR